MNEDAPSPRLDFEPSEADSKWIEQRLEEFNAIQTGRDDEQSVCIVVRDGAGEPIAGIKGVTVLDWMYVSALFVDESHRGAGLGSKLLDEAERVAVDRGCIGVCLTSFGFQAPEFYKQRGYRCVGQIDDYPAGDALYFLTRRLDLTSART